MSMDALAVLDSGSSRSPAQTIVTGRRSPTGDWGWVH
jgi:hypothetical protein